MIDIVNASKEFPIFKSSRDCGKFLFNIHKKDIPTFCALDNINLHIKKGEVLGIIGDNGSGKSTLLKIIAGTLSPTEGKIKVNGDISAILEVSTGFNQELTGRENIWNRLSLQGFAGKDIRKVESEIIEFSELEDVIDKTLKTYSTGMQAKLLFSVVTSTVSKILLIDELLVVGDEHFKGKSFSRIKELCNSGRTVVLVTHSLEYIERLCDRAVWLEKGVVRGIGAAHKVAMDYFGSNPEDAEAKFPKNIAEIKSVDTVIKDSKLCINSVIDRKQKSNGLIFQAAVHDIKFGSLGMLFNSKNSGFVIPSGTGPIRISIEAEIPPGMEQGLIGVAIFNGDSSQIQDSWGWDNRKQIYFSNDEYRNGAYLHLKL